MRVLEAVIVGILIVVGLVIHGVLTRPAADTRPGVQTNDRDVQIKMMEMHPRAVVLGDQHLLVVPRVSFQNNNVSVNHTFYRMQGNQLVIVPVQ